MTAHADDRERDRGRNALESDAATDRQLVADTAWLLGECYLEVLPAHSSKQQPFYGGSRRNGDSMFAICRRLLGQQTARVRKRGRKC